MDDTNNLPDEGGIGETMPTEAQAEDALSKFFDGPEDPATGEDEEATEDKAQDDTEESDDEPLDSDESEDDEDDSEVDQYEDEDDDQEDSEDDNEETDDLQIRLKDGTVATAKEIEEWRQNGLRQADYTRKTQALAEDRKVVDHAVQTFHAQRQQFEQAAQVIQQMAQAVLPTPPDQTLLDRSSDNYDPVAYLEQDAKFQAQQKAFQGQYQQYQQYLQQNQQAQKQALVQQIEAEKQRLAEVMPEVKDPNRRTAIKAELTEALGHYGFEEGELDQIYDSRVILALRDLAKFRKIQAQKPKVKEKSRNAPPIAKPGNRKPKRSNVQRDLDARVAAGDEEAAVANLSRFF
jgi:hypothetical protein